MASSHLCFLWALAEHGASQQGHVLAGSGRWSADGIGLPPWPRVFRLMIPTSEAMPKFVAILEELGPVVISSS